MLFLEENFVRTNFRVKKLSCVETFTPFIVLAELYERLFHKISLKREPRESSLARNLLKYRIKPSLYEQILIFSSYFVIYLDINM